MPSMRVKFLKTLTSPCREIANTKTKTHAALRDLGASILEYASRAPEIENPNIYS